MKSLRPLIRCGCTGELPSHCPNRSYTLNTCKCPCHYTQDQDQTIISAYIHTGGPLSNYMKNIWMKKRDNVVMKEQFTVEMACGHEKKFDYRPSEMAKMYTRQNPCDECREEKLG